MLVAFWSEFHGQTGTTINTIATALYTALNYDLKVLLTHSQYCKSNMENAFFKTPTNSESVLHFEDTGFDAVERLAKSGTLKPEDIHDYAKTIINNRLDFLTGSTSPLCRIGEPDSLNRIFELANRYYDLVFVDVSAGLQNAGSRAILEKADLVVVNLNQNNAVLQSYFENDDLWEAKNPDQKRIYLLGRFDMDSQASERWIKRNYHCKSDLFILPYDTRILDSVNDHQVYEFFLQNNGEEVEETILKQALDRLTEVILLSTNIEVDYYKKPIEKINFFGKVKRNLKGLAG